MKPVVGPLVAAIVLALIGVAFWTVGQTDRRIADVHAQLATLQYTAAATSGEDVDQLLTFERRVPVVGPAASTDLRDTRASAAYWRSDYPAIAPNKDSNGLVAETDPAILFLAANAAFRASQTTTDRNETVRRLDSVVKSYGDVLKTQAAGCGTGSGQTACEARAMDAAYNYEFVVKTREMIARPRPGMSMRNAPHALPKPVDESTADLPSGATLHGTPGGPPPAVDMNQFKIVIPKRGEERKDAPDAGKGGAKIRKG
jgi:hypothetical protein